MDMNLGAECGGSGMDAMTLAVGAGGVLIWLAVHRIHRKAQLVGSSRLRTAALVE